MRYLNVPWAFYVACHRFLNKNFGRACACENPECGYKNPRRYEWALIHGREYSMDRGDYMQLCASCHRKYDMTEETIRKFSVRSKAQKRPAAQVPVLQATLHGLIVAEWPSITRAVAATGIIRTGISNCLGGRSRTAGGFIWRRIK